MPSVQNISTMEIWFSINNCGNPIAYNHAKLNLRCNCSSKLMAKPYIVHTNIEYTQDGASYITNK